MASPCPIAPHRTRIAFRSTATGLAALGLAQASIAGSFLNGHYDMLQVHLAAAMVMVGVAVGQAVVAVLLRRAEQAPGWVVRASVWLPVALAGQGLLGMYRVLGLHIPLGVLVVASSLALAVWSWRSRPPARAGVDDSAEVTRPVGVGS
jgi:hypothetical protein